MPTITDGLNKKGEAQFTVQCSHEQLAFMLDRRMVYQDTTSDYALVPGRMVNWYHPMQDVFSITEVVAYIDASSITAYEREKTDLIGLVYPSPKYTYWAIKPIQYLGDDKYLCVEYDLRNEDDRNFSIWDRSRLQGMMVLSYD